MMKKTKIVVVMMVLCAILAGCTAKAASSPAFNTSTDNPDWGNEANFLRIFKIEPREQTFRAADLPYSEYTFADEGGYIFVMYCRNATSRTLEGVHLELDCPETMHYGETSTATASIKWAENEAQPLTSQM